MTDFGKPLNLIQRSLTKLENKITILTIKHR